MVVPLAFIDFVFSFVALNLTYLFYRLYNVRRFYKDLPKPPHSFLWGHLKIMGEITATLPPNNHPQAYFAAIARKYNLQGIFYLDLWPIGPSQVVLTDPELSDQVHVKRPLPQHPMSADFLAGVIGDQNIAVVNGFAWKSLHNAMAPAFSWSHIRSLTGLMVDECHHFRKELDRLAKTGEIFSMEEIVMKLVFDVIAQIVFNFPLHAQTKGSQHLNDLREMVHLAEVNVDIAKKLNPWVQIKSFFRRRTILGRLHSSINDKVTERYDLLRRGKIVPSRRYPTSILDLMLREKVQNEEQDKQSKPTSLTPKQQLILLHNIKGLLAGGHGTTTSTLCYIYMLLSKETRAMQKLRDEHDQILGKSFEETLNTLNQSPEKLQELPYTDAVIRETLRLFPVGFGVRIAGKDDLLSYQGRNFPIGNNLAVLSNALDIHYNPKYFPEPTKFRPERWLDPKNEIPRSYFRTFGRGPRGCLGQNLAMNEMKVILIMTAGDFDFTCAQLKPNQDPRSNYTDLDLSFGDIIFQELGLEAKPRGGMMMTATVKRRRPVTDD